MKRFNVTLLGILVSVCCQYAQAQNTPVAQPGEQAWDEFQLAPNPKFYSLEALKTKLDDLYTGTEELFLAAPGKADLVLENLSSAMVWASFTDELHFRYSANNSTANELGMMPRALFNVTSNGFFGPTNSSLNSINNIQAFNNARVQAATYLGFGFGSPVVDNGLNMLVDVGFLVQDQSSLNSSSLAQSNSGKADYRSMINLGLVYKF